MTKCASPEDLRRWLAGDLSPDEIHAIGVHVHACPQCQDSLDQETDEAGSAGWRPLVRAAGESTLDDPILNRLLDRLKTDASRQSEPHVDTEPAPPSQPERDHSAAQLRTLGPYQIQCELGRGGMGIVYRAWDELLRRVVALKVLRSGLADESDRRRLIREAQLAASFRNDHAVMVLAVVDPPDDLPYLVMEYIDGPTLAQLIGSAPRPDQARIATLIAQVADALDAAHAAGLVHRDVKPGNILIEEKTGRAKITDFGLASGRAAAAGTLTREALLAGTPNYMSPEQARGEERLDVRSDVYSLGATLYESLTGQPPFTGAPHAVLRRILDEDPIPPRRLDDSIPRDLETICSKAMAREPARRFPTAGELAADLRRWLRGEPICSRPTTRIEHLGRWCRRNPRIAGLAASLVLVFCAGFTGIFWQWRRAEANLRDARTNFAHARRAVDQFYTRFYEQGVLAVPGLETVRHDVLDEMMQYYKTFLEQHHDDPSLRRELAETCLRLGKLTFDQGGRSDALALLRRADRDLEAIDRATPNERKLEDQRIECSYRIAQAEERVGESRSARSTYERGIQNLERLIRKEPGDIRLRRRLAAFNGNLANLLLASLGEKTLARQAYIKALEIQKDLVNREPAQLNFKSDLAMTFNNLMTLTEDLEEQRALLVQALELRKLLAEREPSNNFFRRNVGRTLMLIGFNQSARGQSHDALDSLEQSRRILEQVVVEQPTVTVYQADLAQTYQNLGSTYTKQGNHAEARRALEQSRAIYQKLVHSHPEDPLLRESLHGVEASLAAEATAKSPE